MAEEVDRPVSGETASANRTDDEATTRRALSRYFAGMILATAAAGIGEAHAKGGGSARAAGAPRSGGAAQVQATRARRCTIGHTLYCTAFTIC